VVVVAVALAVTLTRARAVGNDKDMAVTAIAGGSFQQSTKRGSRRNVGGRDGG
jgi:hypothetical protein